MSTVGAALGRPPGELIGRDQDLELIRTFVGGAAVRGGALVLSGEPGVGKTVLLDAGAEAAAAAGFRVERAAGVEFEADVSFSGLHQVLLPFDGALEQLAPPLRDALRVVLGFGGGPAPGRLVVCNAVLALLRLVAESESPVFLVVDDVQWVDRSSAAVLGSVARRLGGMRVGFLAASRPDPEGFFERGGIPGHEVQPLADSAAADLVRRTFSTLAPRIEQRILADAQGNPLALLELPGALSGPQRDALRALPAVLPLSRRLQSLFASRIGMLPAPTRNLLLLAVLDGTGDLRLLQAVAPGPQGLDDLAPAERELLLGMDASIGRLVFRHPLIRSAVVELSTADERRRAHRALAAALTDDPERRAWHLAEAAVEPDEQVADLLEQAAHRTLHRGDAVAAVTALTRAADLSPDPSDRSRRLAEAAYLGAEVTGELRNVPRLLEEARRVGAERADSLQTATVAAALLLNGEGDIDTAHRLLVGAIEMVDDPHDSSDVAVIDALHTLLMVCFFGGRPDLWEPLERATAQLRAPGAPLLSLCVATGSDPARTAAPVIDSLEMRIGGLRDEADPAAIVRTAIAATCVDRLAGCRQALWRVVHDGREGGAVASSIHALILLGYDLFLTGEWDESQRLMDEGLELCELHGYRLLAAPGQVSRALLAAARGDNDVAEALSDEMVRWATPRGVHAVERYAMQVRTLAALGRADFEEGYRQAIAISPAGALAAHVAQALWVAMDLVEAAVRTKRQAEANAHVEAMCEAGIAALSPRLALVVAGSAAMAAPPERAAELFEIALAVPDTARFPFERARVQLVYGEHLRRARATTESRTQLSAALDTFQRLGARPWAARAGNELRATGVRRQSGWSVGAASLTPQEREIAMLAAAGLTNKEIGSQLFLSHRTVSAHLYRIFPKLGITSRAALRDALEE